MQHHLVQVMTASGVCISPLLLNDPLDFLLGLALLVVGGGSGNYTEVETEHPQTTR